MDEPVAALFTQGMVIKEGAKMSKSLGNVVEPDDIVREYGADALRLFIQFAAPPEGDLDWNEQGLEGCFRFLTRIWRLVHRNRERLAAASSIPLNRDLSPEERALTRKLHQTIRKVTADLERVHQNTAIASTMELLNTVADIGENPSVAPSLVREVIEKMTLLLHPFAPHFAEEIWEQLGHPDSLARERWPGFDPELAAEQDVEIAVQVNGKIRSRFTAPVGLAKEATGEMALKDAKVQAALEGKTVRKVIVIPEKLVNIVAN